MPTPPSGNAEPFAIDMDAIANDPIWSANRRGNPQKANNDC
jgi:hypothetical protein